MAGTLTRISAGMAGVWGLNASNQVIDHHNRLCYNHHCQFDHHDRCDHNDHGGNVPEGHHPHD